MCEKTYTNTNATKQKKKIVLQKYQKCQVPKSSQEIEIFFLIRRKVTNCSAKTTQATAATTTAPRIAKGKCKAKIEATTTTARRDCQATKAYDKRQTPEI